MFLYPIRNQNTRKMDSQKVIQELNQSAKILDLPEGIFWKIFQYLDDVLLWFTVSTICRKFKQYVSSYVQIGGVFVDIQTSENQKSARYHATRMFYVFKRHHEVQSVYCKLKPGYGENAIFLNFVLIRTGLIIVGRHGRLDDANWDNQGVLIGTVQLESAYAKRELGCFLWDFNPVEDTCSPFPGSLNLQQVDVIDGYSDIIICQVGESKILLSTYGKMNYENDLLLLDLKVDNENKYKSKLKCVSYTKSIRKMIMNILPYHILCDIRILMIVKVSHETV